MLGLGLVEPGVGDTDKEPSTQPVGKEDHCPLAQDIHERKGFNIFLGMVKGQEHKGSKVGHQVFVNEEDKHKDGRNGNENLCGFLLEQHIAHDRHIHKHIGRNAFDKVAPIRLAQLDGSCCHHKTILLEIKEGDSRLQRGKDLHQQVHSVHLQRLLDS